LLLLFDGWGNRRQLAVVDYLMEESRYPVPCRNRIEEPNRIFITWDAAVATDLAADPVLSGNWIVHEKSE
jgi:hypothetical protein